MGRRSRTSPLEDMIELVSRLPWWAGLMVAVIGYVVCAQLAIPRPVAPYRPGQVVESILPGVIAGFATLGQLIFPIVGLVGSLISFFAQKRRAKLVFYVANSKNISTLNGMSWRDFERLVSEAFRLQGFGVEENNNGGADGGVDLVLTKDGKKYLVQCKQWKARQVGVEVVRELYGVIAAKGATGGYVVTSGRFTDDAKAFAANIEMHLLDGPKLFTLIQRATRSFGNPPVRPSCPQCGATMIKRSARKGDTAGHEFWGCAKFPSCRGTRQLV